MRVIVLLAVLATAACNARFDADFEGDAVGSLPPSSPPGLPNGDEIAFTQSAVSGAGTILRITDNPGLVAPGRPHRHLSLLRDPDPGIENVAFLRTRTLTTSTQSLFLTWEQVIDGGGTGEIVISRFPLGAVEDLTTCFMNTGNDTISIRCLVDGEGPVVEDALDGFDTHTPHTVIVRIDRPDGPMVVQVNQEGGTTGLVALEAPGMSWPGESERLQVQISFNGQTDGAYRFNSFLIAERDPG